jgi:hypothetical protein
MCGYAAEETPCRHLNLLIPDNGRGADKQKNFLKGITAATNFTHHQVPPCTFAFYVLSADS